MHFPVKFVPISHKYVNNGVFRSKSTSYPFLHESDRLVKLSAARNEGELASLYTQEVRDNILGDILNHRELREHSKTIPYPILDWITASLLPLSNFLPPFSRDSQLSENKLFLKFYYFFSGLEHISGLDNLLGHLNKLDNLLYFHYVLSYQNVSINHMLFSQLKIFPFFVVLNFLVTDNVFSSLRFSLKSNPEGSRRIGGEYFVGLHMVYFVILLCEFMLLDVELL